MAELDRQVQATLDLFVTSYPAFSEVKPLAVGTREKLLERHPDIALRLLRAALVKHCKRPRYLKALASDPHRYDLEGNPAGLVTPEEREKAVSALQQHHDQEQATIQRRLEHAQRELEAARRKAERLAARELKQLRTRAAKPAKKAGPKPAYRDAAPRSRAPAPAADEVGQRRPVIIIKKRPRNSGTDAAT